MRMILRNRGWAVVVAASMLMMACTDDDSSGVTGATESVDKAGDGTEYRSDGYTDGDVGGDWETSESYATMLGFDDPAESTGVQSGTLTAGVWDDNLNFDFYLSYLSTHDQAELPGRPVIFQQHRLVVHVADDGGEAVSGVRVVLFDGDAALDSTLTGADGRALFFPGATIADTLIVRGTLDEWTDETTVSPDQGTVDLVMPSAAVGPVTELDLALIIDTTGSMGDELHYLAAEIDAIATAIADALPGIDQRYGLVLYRDMGDEYVTRVFDFTSDLVLFQQNLGAQRANGGGDYPEALDQGLQAGVELSWRGGRTARVAFVIADAPHHVDSTADVVDAVSDARDKGIRLYPVAASGADDLTEYTLRTLAQVTGGRYIFLTDDSGVGGEHLEPSIPCYQVTRLDQAMTRVVKVEVTGTHIAVDPDQVIRTVGNPDADTGRCVLEDETQVTYF